MAVVSGVQRSLRRLGLILAGALALFIALHLAILAAWQQSVLPELLLSPRAARLTAAFARFPPTTPDAWTRVELLNLRLRLPLQPSTGNGPWRCEEGCWVPLVSGRLRIKAESRTESYWETVNLLAPDRGDTSLRHAPWRNWATILALSRRVRNEPFVPGTWRFEAKAARGVVTTYSNHSVLRHVVYAYSRSGSAAPPLTFTRTPTETVIRILGSLEIE